jgi:hypothetical protein
MNLTKNLRYVPRRVYRAETLQYLDRIYLNGGSISEASLVAVDQFVVDCKAANIWTKMIEVGPFAGANLNAALVKLAYQSGGSGVLTNSNFVSGDYVETGSSAGLLGDGTKFLNTGVLADSLPANAHMSFYLREDVVQTGNRMLMGAASGTDHSWLGSLIPASQVDFRCGVTTTVSNATAFTKGFYVGSRESSTSLSIYRDGTSLNTNVSATGAGRAAFAMYLWGYNLSSAATARIATRGCFYSIGDALTPSEVTALNTAVRALQIALNRNIN